VLGKFAWNLDVIEITFKIAIIIITYNNPHKRFCKKNVTVFPWQFQEDAYLEIMFFSLSAQLRAENRILRAIPIFPKKS